MAATAASTIVAATSPPPRLAADHGLSCFSQPSPGNPVTVGPVVVKPRDPSLGDQRCVAVLNTGGTISMKANAVGSLEPSPGYLAERVCAMAEFRRADMPAVDLFELLPLIDSSDMGPEDWTRIAAIIESLYYEYDGFVVVMGTDTMAYCGSALSFLLENLHKPVVLTGAMLPLVDLFNDAHRNLIVSIVLASILDVPEVCIFINDKLMRGNRTVKVNSSGLDAFDSPNFPPLALLETGIRFRPHLCLPQPRGRFRVHKALSTAVAVWRMVPGFDDEYIRVSVEHATSLRAIVLELYGTGNLSARKRTLIDALSKAIDKGIIIVAASQCLRGTVNLSAYALGKQLESIGVVQAGDMTTEALCAKLSYLLAVPGITRDQVISYMGRSLRGEITETKPVIVMGGRGLHGVLPMPQQHQPLPAAGFAGVGGAAGAGFGGSAPVAHPVDPLHPLHRSHLSTGSLDAAALPVSSPGTGSSASAARARALACEASAGTAAAAASAAGTGGTAAPVRVVTQPSPHSVTWGGAGGYTGHSDGSGAAVAVALPHESTIKITGDPSAGSGDVIIRMRTLEAPPEVPAAGPPPAAGPGLYAPASSIATPASGWSSRIDMSTVSAEGALEVPRLGPATGIQAHNHHHHNNNRSGGSGAQEDHQRQATPVAASSGSTASGPAASPSHEHRGAAATPAKPAGEGFAGVDEAVAKLAALAVSGRYDFSPAPRGGVVGGAAAGGSGSAALSAVASGGGAASAVPSPAGSTASSASTAASRGSMRLTMVTPFGAAPLGASPAPSQPQ